MLVYKTPKTAQNMSNKNEFRIIIIKMNGRCGAFKPK